MNNNDLYINIKDIAEAKGLTSTRAIRLKLNDPECGYISREVKVSGGTSYEILFSSLEPETQKLLLESNKKSTALIPLNYQPPQFVSDSAKMTANFRTNIVVALQKLRKKYSTKKEADSVFLDLYNSGLYLPKAYKFIGSISIGTLHRWVQAFEKHESAECLQPRYKWTRQGEYNSILNDEMKHILLTFLLHPSQYNYGKAIKLTKEILKKRGYEHLPCDLSFKRFAEHFRKNNYAEWVLRREGMKAYHDKVEPYIERDIDKIEVGDVIVADGHVLNFQVINPFTGNPTRATLVGFLDWKSTALIGYEIMMTESTQCIASALRNAILNLGMIPKVVYQDNGKAFKSRFFQNCDFEEEGFNGVYANLNIHSVFAKPYNARAKVIERFFREFQEELEKGMPSYIGTSIENKPAWLKRGEHLHQEWHKRLTNNHIPTVQEAIKYINSWLELHNSQSCPNNRNMTIKEMLNTVQKQDIPVQVLDDLMMKTETRTINKHGITFLKMHYRSDAILGIRDKVNIRYSLFDLSKINVYSTKDRTIEHASRVFDEKLKNLDAAYQKMYAKTNIVMNSKILNPNKIPMDEQYGVRVLNLTDENIPSDMDLGQYGMNGTTKDNLRLTVHMVAEDNLLGNLESAKLGMESTTNDNNVWSISMIKMDRTRTYMHREYGFATDTPISSIAIASPNNLSSGYEKGVDKFVELLFTDNPQRNFLKQRFMMSAQAQGRRMSEADYQELSRMVYNKSFLSQLKTQSEIEVNGNVYPTSVIVKAIQESTDALFTGQTHTEFVASNPKIQGLVVRKNSMAEVAPDFIAFAKKYNLPILLVGNK